LAPRGPPASESAAFACEAAVAEGPDDRGPLPPDTDTATCRRESAALRDGGVERRRAQFVARAIGRRRSVSVTGAAGSLPTSAARSGVRCAAMAASKFYRLWQPLDGASEDVHTALVFGYLRHAPAKAALAPWLTHVGEPVAVDELELDAHWPDYESVFGGTTTQPELAFSAAIGGRMRLIVIENKIYEPHTLDQTHRELIDSVRKGDAIDATLVMVGPYGRCPYGHPSNRG
jgi:hypothetical protein